MTEEEWTLPRALSDLTAAVKALPDLTPTLTALVEQLKRLCELIDEFHSKQLIVTAEEGVLLRKAVDDGVKEIVKAYREEMEKSRTKPLKIGGE